MTEQQPSPDAVTQPADPWPDSPYPAPLPAAAGPGADPGARRSWSRWRVAAVSGTAVVAVIAFLAALAWPTGNEPAARVPAFRPMELVRQIDFVEPTEQALSQIVNGTAYVAWQQDADLELAAVDLATGEPRWQRRLTGPDGHWWGALTAGPGTVAVTSYPAEDDAGPRSLTVVDAETGGEQYRWDRVIHPDDEVWLSEHALVLVDRFRGALRGLRLDTGVHQWVVPFPGPPEAGAAVVPVLTEGALADPSTWWGEPAAVAAGQLVLIGEDRSARVIDTRTGEPVGEVGTNVADPDDLLLAYQGRLFVAWNGDGYQVLAWDLAALAGQPDHIYTVLEPARRPTGLAPCGADLLCVLDDRFDWYEAGTRLRMLDVSADRAADPQRWVRDVPGAQWLVPAGGWLLAGGGDPPLVGYDRDGDQVATRSDGVAVRLDRDNLLFFSTWPDSYLQDLSVTGQPVGGERVELGQLTEVRGEGCSWNEAYLVCPAADSAGIWRFR